MKPLSRDVFALAAKRKRSRQVIEDRFCFLPQGDDHFFSTLKRTISSKISALFGLRQAAARARQNISDADANLDSLIDEQELAEALKGNARAYELLKVRARTCLRSMR